MRIDLDERIERIELAYEDSIAMKHSLGIMATLFSWTIRVL